MSSGAKETPYEKSQPEGWLFECGEDVIQSYFCDGYCSWQKGGIEKLNKLIRQYLLRQTDLSKLANDDIYQIQERLNNRPRKSFNYLTPNEVFANYLKSGALNP